VEENLRIGLPPAATAAARIPERIFELFPVLRRDAARAAAATSPAASSSSWPSAGRWCSSPSLLILDEPTEGIQPNIVPRSARSSAA
jgi:urea transport system ATP-binding protein